MLTYYTRILIAILSILPPWYSFAAIIDAPTTKKPVPSLVDLTAPKLIDALLAQKPEKLIKIVRDLPEDIKNILKKNVKEQPIATLHPKSWAHIIAMSPDNKYILTAGSPDKIVRLWNLETGSPKELKQLHALADLQFATFSPDGNYALIGSDTNSAVLLAIPSGELMAELKTPAAMSTGTFSPDSHYALTGEYLHAARLWKIPTGELIATLSHDGFVSKSAFSPDGNYALTGSAGTVRLWSIPSAELKKEFGVGTGIGFKSIVFNTDGTKALIGLGNGTIHLLSIPSGELIKELKGIEILQALSPDGNYALTIPPYKSSTTSAFLWSIESGKPIQEFKGHSERTNLGAFSPNSKYAITVSPDTIHVWYIGSDDTSFEQLLLKLQEKRLSAENTNK